MFTTIFPRFLLRWWWLVIIPTVIAAAFALPALLRNEAPSGGGFNTAFSYSAAQNLEAIPRTEGDYQDIWLSSELTVNALTDWVTSSTFANEVAQRLQTQGTNLDASAVRFTADNERSVGWVYVSWPDAESLAQIADAAIWVLSSRNADYFAQLGGTPATVTILDAPRVAPAPPQLVDRLDPIVRIVLGLLAGLALAFAADLLDPMLRRKEDLEALGLPVVVTIPRR